MKVYANKILGHYFVSHEERAGVYYFRARCGIVILVMHDYCACANKLVARSRLHGQRNREPKLTQAPGGMRNYIETLNSALAI